MVTEAEQDSSAAGRLWAAARATREAATMENFILKVVVVKI